MQAGGPIPIESRRVWLLPAAMVVIFLGMSFGIWRMARESEISAARIEAAEYRESLGRRLSSALQDKLTPIQWRWLSGRLDSPDGFSEEASDLLAANPQLGFIAWVDGDGVCHDARGRNVAEMAIGKNLADDETWSRLFNLAQTNGDGASSSVTPSATGQEMIDVVLPGVDGGVNGPSDGAILFQIILSPILDGLVDPSVRQNLSLDLSDGDKPFLKVRSPGDSKELDKTAELEPVQVMDRIWTLRAQPSQQLISKHLSIIPAWAVLLWLSGTLLLGASAYQLARYRTANNRRLTHYLHALEMVAETSAAMIGKIGASQEVWQLIPSAARKFTGASSASVAVLEENDSAIRFVATDGNLSGIVGRRVALADMPGVQRCVQTQQVVNIADVRRSGAVLNRREADAAGVLSFLHIPLVAEEKVIGVLMVGSAQAGSFDAASIRLAELWGRLAAVTISNEHMYEQMSAAIAAHERLLRQRDALFNVNAPMAGQRSVEDFLQRIVELAAAPLGVDVCQIALHEASAGEMVVAATTPPYDSLVRGFRYRAEGANSYEAMRSKRLMVVEDGPADPTTQPYLKTVLPCGSIMHVPLLSPGGKPIGVLVLLRKQTGGFTAEQQNLAQLFASRAAVAIENAQLYQQTLRDAQTQAMLLRELAHRVKNSLSGIVALLSIDQPPMSPQARQWLSRVTDRIRTIARTHEMLTSGKLGGSLHELIERTFQSLAVVTPAGVTTRCEQEGGDVILRADRAVSVAMVLHELCYNSLVHGLNGHGSLIVRSIHLPGKMLRIEVVDNGRGYGEEDESAARWSEGSARSTVLGVVRTGLGLNLVRDFVGRELRGRFYIESKPAQGTTASFEFALMEEEFAGGE